MTADPQGEVTRLLNAVDAGRPGAKDELFEVVHAQLRRIAGGMMVRERNDHTLQPTALVSEAYPKLDVEELPVRNRAYFFAAWTNAMRQVLVDHARKHNADIHGGKRKRVPIDGVLDWLRSSQDVDILALDEALGRLEEFGKRQYEVVKLRFFGGLKNEEVAEHLHVSVSTVEKDWKMARAWLHAQLKERKNDA